MGQLNDGYKTTILFATSDIALAFEREVSPPGFEGGGPIPTSTMLNTTYETSSPNALIGMTPCTFVAAYDIEVYDEIIAAMNVNQLITITFPDTGTLAFYGWLDDVKFDNLVPKEQPKATFTVIPSLTDAVGAETAPVVTPVV